MKKVAFIFLALLAVTGYMSGQTYLIDKIDSVAVSDYNSIRTFDLSGGKVYYEVVTDDGIPDYYYQQTQDLLARYIIIPDTAFMNELDDFIGVLVRTGIWDSLDIAYILANQNRIDAKLNIISDTYNLTENNQLTFTAGEGFKSLAAPDAALLTGWKPLVTSKYKLTNFSFGLYCSEGGVYGNYVDFGQSYVDTVFTGIFIKQTETKARYYLNGLNKSMANATDTGFFAASLYGTTYRIKNNDVNSDATSQTAVRLPNYTWDILAGNSKNGIINESPREISFAFAGASLSNAQLDSLKAATIKFQKSVSALSYTIPPLYYYRSGNDLYIAQEFSDTSDLVITFDSTMFNKLITFKKISLNDKIDEWVGSDLTESNLTIDDFTSADAIGPYGVAGGNFVSGNHALTGAWTGIASNYTAGQTTMTLNDASSFVSTGGSAQATNFSLFTYTGKIGNQLTGVNCSVSMTTSDTVRLYHKTATNISYTYKVNGSNISNGYGYADSINVFSRNTVWDMSTLNLTTGLSDPLLYEYVYYTIKDTSIYVDLYIYPQKSVSLINYYGMQFHQGAVFDSIKFVDGQNSNYQLMGNDLSSGASSTYTCNEIVLSVADKSLNLSMIIDNTGLGSTPRINLDATDDMAFTSNGKVYHRLIGKTTTLNIGNVYHWKGKYKFY